MSENRCNKPEDTGVDATEIDLTVANQEKYPTKTRVDVTLPNNTQTTVDAVVPAVTETLVTPSNNSHHTKSVEKPKPLVINPEKNKTKSADKLFFGPGTSGLGSGVLGSIEQSGGKIRFTKPEALRIGVAYGVEKYNDKSDEIIYFREGSTIFMGIIDISVLPGGESVKDEQLKDFKIFLKNLRMRLPEYLKNQDNSATDDDKEQKNILQKVLEFISKTTGDEDGEKLSFGGSFEKAINEQFASDVLDYMSEQRLLGKVTFSLTFTYFKPTDIGGELCVYNYGKGSGLVYSEKNEEGGVQEESTFFPPMTIEGLGPREVYKNLTKEQREFVEKALKKGDRKVIVGALPERAKLRKEGKDAMFEPQCRVIPIEFGHKKFVVLGSDKFWEVITTHDLQKVFKNKETLSEIYDEVRKLLNKSNDSADTVVDTNTEQAVPRATFIVLELEPLKVDTGKDVQIDDGLSATKTIGAQTTQTNRITEEKKSLDHSAEFLLSKIDDFKKNPEITKVFRPLLSYYKKLLSEGSTVSDDVIGEVDKDISDLDKLFKIFSSEESKKHPEKIESILNYLKWFIDSYFKSKKNNPEKFDTVLVAFGYRSMVDFLYSALSRTNFGSDAHDDQSNQYDFFLACDFFVAQSSGSAEEKKAQSTQVEVTDFIPDRLVGLFAGELDRKIPKGDAGSAERMIFNSIKDGMSNVELVFATYYRDSLPSAGYSDSWQEETKKKFDITIKDVFLKVARQFLGLENSSQLEDGDKKNDLLIKLAYLSQAVGKNNSGQAEVDIDKISVFMDIIGALGLFFNAPVKHKELFGKEKIVSDSTLSSGDENEIKKEIDKFSVVLSRNMKALARVACLVYRPNLVSK